MIKKDYKKPTMKVVQLRHRLLLGSETKTLSGHAKSSEETQDTWYELE